MLSPAGGTTTGTSTGPDGTVEPHPEGVSVDGPGVSFRVKVRPPRQFSCRQWTSEGAAHTSDRDSELASRRPSGITHCRRFETAPLAMLVIGAGPAEAAPARTGTMPGALSFGKIFETRPAVPLDDRLAAAPHGVQLRRGQGRFLEGRG